MGRLFRYGPRQSSLGPVGVSRLQRGWEVLRHGLIKERGHCCGLILLRGGIIASFTAIIALPPISAARGVARSCAIGHIALIIVLLIWVSLIEVVQLITFYLEVPTIVVDFRPVRIQISNSVTTGR